MDLNATMILARCHEGRGPAVDGRPVGLQGVSSHFGGEGRCVWARDSKGGVSKVELRRDALWVEIDRRVKIGFQEKSQWDDSRLTFYASLFGQGRQWGADRHVTAFRRKGQFYVK